LTHRRRPRAGFGALTGASVHRARVRFGHESSGVIRDPHEIHRESANSSGAECLTGPVFCPSESRDRARSEPFGVCPPSTRGCGSGVRRGTGGLVQRGYARGGSGEGVRGPIAYLPRLLGGVHLLQRRAGILFKQGPAERPPTLPGMSSGGKAGTDRRRPTGVSCGHLRQLRWAGDGPVRATERPPRLLQLVLRQGSGWNDQRVGDRLTTDRESPPRADPTRGRLVDSRRMDS
jgi:hypothetical protein